tara:strand:+ start:50 stop:532 length:483 start_codon:yes stop_codon:yes gene_type:complete
MSDSFTERVEAAAKTAAKKTAKTATKTAAKTAAKKTAKAVTKWNPESDKYNEKRGAELIKKYPLHIPKPPIPDDPTKEITVVQPEKDGYAHEAWVWHPENKEEGLKGEWLKHQASFDPDTAMLLKGMQHPTIGKTLAGEKAFSEIFKGEGGYYYRRPLNK